MWRDGGVIAELSLAPTMSAFAIGVLGSLCAAICWEKYQGRNKSSVGLVRTLRKSGRRLRANSVSDVRFARDDYERTFRQEIELTKNSIEVIAFSLKQTDSAALGQVLIEKLRSNQAYQVHISLIEPGSAAATIAAENFGITAQQLDHDVIEALHALDQYRQALEPHQIRRFALSTHTRPEAAATLFDCHGERTDQTAIQLELTLHAVPRSFCFGYTVRQGSLFFSRNLAAFRAVLAGAKPVVPAEVVDSPSEGG